ncbi:hypothetical protein CPB85DRAFT_1312100 [Mucidula mucida]|nr:hypothetical protein CPB85DRAFT_1312100 [Mucidula mucida]
MSNTLNRRHGALIDVDPLARVESLATPNDPPMERERREMSETLIRLSSIIKNLPKRKWVQKAKLEAYAAKLASVIFSYLVTEPHDTCQSVKDNDFVDSLDTKSGVWALTHVCARWRGVVNTTSPLWTTVGLQFDKYSKCAATADILTTYLARSNQYALNVVIHSEHEISEHPALEVLINTCERWRGGWFALPLETFLAWQTPFPFRRLQKLRVCFRPPPPLPVAAFAEASPLKCRAFEDTPVLKDVAVDNHIIFYNLFKLDWSIVHLFCLERRLSEDFSACYPVSDILYTLIILSQASSLNIAHFDLSPFDTKFEVEWLASVQDYIFRNGGIIRNTATTSLVLKGAPEAWRRMLSTIELPNLQTLHCHPSPADNFPAPLPAVTGNSVRKLVVHIVAKTNTGSIIAFLRTMPNVVEFEMIFDESFDIGPMCTDIFYLTPGLLPRLRTLTVSALPGVKVIIRHTFIEAVKRRVDGRGFSKSWLELNVVQSELTVVNNMVQADLDDLLLGPDPFLFQL